MLVELSLGLWAQAGQAPKCLMDFWALRCLEEVKEAETAGEPAPRHTGNPEMADTVMDFLFASQDASTASLVWMIVLMAEHPDVAGEGTLHPQEHTHIHTHTERKRERESQTAPVLFS